MIRSLISLLALLASAAAAPASPQAPSAPSAAQLVTARQAGMHMAATLLYGSILPRAKGEGDIKDRHAAEGIALWAAAIPGLFPPGSRHPDSRADPNIWASPEDFASKANALREAADRLATASDNGDRAAFTAEATRVRDACESCHIAYRAN